MPYNDLAGGRGARSRRTGDIAAVIIEPVAGNMGLVPPAPGYLEGLRALTQKHGTLLIFDEVMTGFRVAYGGAQERYGITPDLTCLGKIVGGGLPAAAFGGRADIMQKLAPLGPVYQAGTLQRQPARDGRRPQGDRDPRRAPAPTSGSSSSASGSATGSWPRPRGRRRARRA